MRIVSPRLAPVVELEPATFATATRETPDRSAAEVPELWERYWSDSLADAGLRALAPIVPGSWHVSVTDLTTSQLSIIVANALEETGVPGFPDADGEVEEELAERVTALNGGMALFDGKTPLIEPTCCGDLGNLAEWRHATARPSAEWADLWIGHPHLRVRAAGSDLEIEETEATHPRRFVVAVERLRRAVAEAVGELERFESAVRGALVAVPPLADYSSEQLDRLARLLAGRARSDLS